MLKLGIAHLTTVQDEVSPTITCHSTEITKLIETPATVNKASL